VVLGGEGLEEEGGEGGGGDVLGGEPEDLSDLTTRIELGRLGKLEGCVALEVFIGKGKWVRWIIRRARNMRESLYTWL